MASDTKTSSTVCIVGAGPVGLFTALLLAQSGIVVSVFERENAVNQSPRAMGYFKPTQDEFRKAGILDEIKEAGLLNDQGLKWRLPNEGGLLAELPGGPDPSYYPIQLGQHVVCEIILKRLKQFPKAHVYFGHELQSLEQSEGADSAITVTTHYSGGHEHTSQYLVGADGGKSTVRKLTGIGFEGFTWENFQLVALNIEYDLASFGWSPGNSVIGDDVSAVVAMLDNKNHWRVAYPVPASELALDAPYDEPREYARARVKLAKLLPGPTEEAKIDLLSLYQVRQLCADRFVHGHVALAGDAAHLTCPFGGLGLTMGLLDAALLGWTLKKIINESEPLELLKSYGDTRRGVYQNVANPAAIFHTHLMTGRDPESVAKREAFLDKVNSRDFAYLAKIGEVFNQITSTADK